MIPYLVFVATIRWEDREEASGGW